MEENQQHLKYQKKYYEPFKQAQHISCPQWFDISHLQSEYIENYKSKHKKCIPLTIYLYPVNHLPLSRRVDQALLPYNSILPQPRRSSKSTSFPLTNSHTPSLPHTLHLPLLLYIQK